MSRHTIAIRPLGGLREGARGDRGEAAEMVNFTVTDRGLLTLRPGVRSLELPFSFDLQNQEIRGLWAGFLGQEEFLAVATSPAGAYGDDGDYIQLFRRDSSGFSAAGLLLRPFGAKTAWVHFFTFCGALYALSDQGYLQISQTGISTGGVPGLTAKAVEPYVPLVVTGADPAGGGTALEQINRLTDRRRISYSADGSAAYQLPQEAAGVERVQVDGAEATGSFNTLTRVFTFHQAPAAGTDNAEFTYLAMNEIRVDGADAPLTALVRHGSSLIALKPDGAWSIVYSPLTLPDGTVTAGFYLRPLHRSLGHYPMGQAVLVENCPRTVMPGALYDWQLPSGYLRDERQAVLISRDVARLLRDRDPRQAVALQDSGRGDYYLFSGGEALVHRYRLGIWCRYQGAAFQDVRFAEMCAGEPVFAGVRGVYTLDAQAAWDYLPERTAIEARWQSGPVDLAPGCRVGVAELRLVLTS